MEYEETNKYIAKIDQNGLVLSRPGHLLTRMTWDVLPVALRKKEIDDFQASPAFELGCAAYAAKEFEKAREELTKAAELGHRVAQFRLAMMFLEGIGGNADYHLAYNWFHRAAEQGDPDSLNKLGWMCEAGFGVDRDHARAVNWFRQAAERGHLEAQFNLAAKYDNGEGVSQNYAESARWYRLAAEQGLADARFFLAQALEEGEGLPRNMDEAIDWYILAAEQGHRSAKLRIWSLALSGKYIPEDDSERIFIESIGVEMKNPIAEFKFAFRYLSGNGIKRNLNQAIELYLKSAEKGFLSAIGHLQLIQKYNFTVSDELLQKIKNLRPKADLYISKSAPSWMLLEYGSSDLSKVNKFRDNLIRAEGGGSEWVSELACDYYFGRGTAVNYSRAQEWAEKGAKFNDNYCQYLLGYILCHGIGGVAIDMKCGLSELIKSAKSGNSSAARLAASFLIEDSRNVKNVEQAVSLWTELAERGDSNSQFDLGYFYSKNSNPDSQEKSVYWYTKAADQGNKAALFNLGIKFEYGVGVKKDIKMALHLYKKSAASGLIAACDILGEIYASGRFGEKDLEESQHWLDEAKRLRVEKEKEKLSETVLGLDRSSVSSRSKRLDEKRALQRKVSRISRPEDESKLDASGSNLESSI